MNGAANIADVTLNGKQIAHPEAGKIVGALMQKMIASRGDVAKSANNNANLQKMLAGMSFPAPQAFAGEGNSGCIR